MLRRRRRADVRAQASQASLPLCTKQNTVTRTDICGLNDEDWPCLGCSHTRKPVDQGKVRKIIQEAVNQQQEEDIEVEARRNNLVLYNIPENQSEKHNERLNADKGFIVTMCDDVAGIRIDDLDILKCIRLGAYSDDKYYGIWGSHQKSGLPYLPDRIFRLSRHQCACVASRGKT